MKQTTPSFIFFDNRESFIASFLKDAVTAVMLSYCVYISSESTFWTFVAAIMFVLFLANLALKENKQWKKFNSKQQLLSWVNTLPDNDG